jgi:formylglycine-generating enzyme required for sulfatase activity
MTELREIDPKLAAVRDAQSGRNLLDPSDPNPLTIDTRAGRPVRFRLVIENGPEGLMDVTIASDESWLQPETRSLTLVGGETGECMLAAESDGDSEFATLLLCWRGTEERTLSTSVMIMRKLPGGVRQQPMTDTIRRLIVMIMRKLPGGARSAPAAIVQGVSQPPGVATPLITNSIGMKLVLIPAGEFLMGSPDRDGESRTNEKPQHRVRITRPFYLGVYQVTQADYKKVLGNNPSYFQTGTDARNRPVECVSWSDAVEFCKRLSELPDEQLAGRVYRLPTEAEWEYGCRAGSTTRYCFGDDERLLLNYAWFGLNSHKTTHPVGQKRPNPWGLYDIYGNVWEWCADRYGSGYYAQSPIDAPTGAASGSSSVRRGGGWCYAAEDCRSAVRKRFSPEKRTIHFGFRVAADSVGDVPE